MRPLGDVMVFMPPLSITAGCINGTVLLLEYAAQRGVRVRGYILNELEAESSPAAQTNARSLASLLPGRCLGVMRYEHPLPAEIKHLLS